VFVYLFSGPVRDFNIIASTVEESSFINRLPLLNYDCASPSVPSLVDFLIILWPSRGVYRNIGQDGFRNTSQVADAGVEVAVQLSISWPPYWHVCVGMVRDI
jgi:hypothetical protein